MSMVIDKFGAFFQLQPDKKFDKNSNSVFTLNSMGAGTSRDAWVINSSKNRLKENILKTIDFYNEQVEGFKLAKIKDSNLKVDDYIDRSPDKISWSSSLIPNVERANSTSFESAKIVQSSYRPFNYQFIYFGDKLIHRRGQFEEIFSGKLKETQNRIICISTTNKGLGLLITNYIADIHYNGDTQCFPLYYYEENKATQKGLFDNDESQKYVRRDAISDFILERAKQQYGKTVTKEDIFYYVYGFLHSNEYRETFANDLKKMLPRLPLVETVTDFWAFSKAGRKLAELHLNYETVAPSPDVTVTGDDGQNYSVDKMRFPKKDQKETINYNSKITLSNIPAKAYEYVVNGKSAIEWIMERYAVTTHKESGIVNDPNDWAKEVGNPRYILDLLLSIINVSVQTVDIVNSLPKVDFGIEPTESKVINMYPTREEDEQINIAAEPEHDE
jgi:predicted helicase